MLSWTCTVHKVRVISLISAAVNFDLEKYKSFNEGQMYVVLSRAASIENHFMIGK